jgi:hypothetical protein
VNFLTRPTANLFGNQPGRRNDIVQQAMRDKSCNLGVLELLVRRADCETLSQAFWIALGNSMDDRMEMCLQNVEVSHRESVLRVSEALVSVVEAALRPNFEHQCLVMAELLLGTGGADVNFQGAECLKKVAESGHTDILQLLLRYSPSNHSLTDMLGFVRNLPAALSKDSAIQLLLDARSRPPDDIGYFPHAEMQNSGSQSLARAHTANSGIRLPPELQIQNSHPQFLTRAPTANSGTRLPPELEDLALLKEVSKGNGVECSNL